MIKRYLYAGLVLLIFGAALIYLVSGYVTTGTPTNVVNLTVPGGRIGDVPIQVNASAISIMFVFTSNSTDIYFLNQSAFSGLSGYLNANSPRSAYDYVKAQKVSKDDIFQNNSSAIKEERNQIPGSGAGSYYVYAVIDSTRGSPSSNGVVNASVVYKSYSYSSWEQNSGESLVGVAAIILGIGLLIYGAVKKPKAAVAAQDAPAEMPQGPKRRKG